MWSSIISKFRNFSNGTNLFSSFFIYRWIKTGKPTDLLLFQREKSVEIDCVNFEKKEIFKQEKQIKLKKQRQTFCVKKDFFQTTEKFKVFPNS